MVPLRCATVSVCRGTGSKRRVRDLEAGPQLQNSLTSRSIGVTEFWHNVKYLMVFFSSTRWLEYFGVCPALSDAPWTVWITENDPDVCSSSGKSMSPLCVCSSHEAVLLHRGSQEEMWGFAVKLYENMLNPLVTKLPRSSEKLLLFGCRSGKLACARRIIWELPLFCPTWWPVYYYMDLIPFWSQT